MDARLETVLQLLLLLRDTRSLTSSGVGVVERGATNGWRLDLKDALRVPGMYVAGGRSSRKPLLEDLGSRDLVGCCAIAADWFNGDLCGLC